MRFGIFIDNIDDGKLDDAKAVATMMESLFHSKAFVFYGDSNKSIKLPSIRGIIDFNDEKTERKCEIKLPDGHIVCVSAEECLTYCKQILIQRPGITDVYSQVRILQRCGVTDRAFQFMFDLNVHELFSLKSEPFPYVEAKWKQEFSNILCRDEAEEQAKLDEEEFSKNQKSSIKPKQPPKKQKQSRWNTAVVDKLKKAMEERGLTISQVVQMSGKKISYPTIYNFFHNGVTGVRPQTAEAIEEFLSSLK